jgi:Ca-activated chloride channel family protein
VDAGDIGSGHSVTAIYEITPVGSPAVTNDPLRYGEAAEAAAGGDASDEYAFLKLRYKLPDETNEQADHDAGRAATGSVSLQPASDDTRFSIAVAAFGQKLRDTDAVAGYSWDAIRDLAAARAATTPMATAASSCG